MKWFHAIGICGKSTSTVSIMFKKMGWFVTGSDLQFFPPASDLLKQAEIPTVEGFSYKHLTKEFWLDKIPVDQINEIPDKPDLCLIVESATSKNKEYLYAKKQGIDVRPYSEILHDYLIKPESIVVIGTAGKTTTTSLLTFLLQNYGLNPSYMIGGEAADILSPLENTDSNWSVMEGDEYYSKELSKGAKFLQYKPKYLVITKVTWEHFDLFPTQEDYVNEFKKIVKILPSDGLIVAKYGDKNIDAIVQNSSVRVLRYAFCGNEDEINSLAGCDYFILKENKNYKILNSKKETLTIGTLNLIGDYNFENVLAAFILTNEIEELQKFKPEFANIVSKFHGVKKRLEIIHNSDKITIIDDFGISPERAENSLKTLRENYPSSKIIAVFEPNSGSRPVEEEMFKDKYKNAFKNADFVIIPELSKFNEELIDSTTMVKYLKDLNVNVLESSSEELNAKIRENLDSSKHNLVIYFSAYRLTEIGKSLIQPLESRD